MLLQFFIDLLAQSLRSGEEDDREPGTFELRDRMRHVAVELDKLVADIEQDAGQNLPLLVASDGFRHYHVVQIVATAAAAATIQLLSL